MPQINRVVIAAHKDFDDQRIMQQAMLKLKREAPNAVVVCGANKADKMAGQLWKLLGGQTIVDEPDFTRGENRKLVMQNRDKRVLTHITDLCISFEVRRQKGWFGVLCENRRIRTISYDSVYQTVDAD